MENLTDDRGLVLVDLEIKYLMSAFVDATLVDEAFTSCSIRVLVLMEVLMLSPDACQNRM